MSETNDNLTTIKSERKLADAVRSVKNAAADRSDVVIDMRDAERMRLELLANELSQVIADVPGDADMFDFAISSGLQPRFWVDAISHVAMGRDKRTYRFVRDTRNGRVVIKESIELKPVADAVTHYVAERMVERERMLDGGEPISFRQTEQPGADPAPIKPLAEALPEKRADGKAEENQSTPGGGATKPSSAVSSIGTEVKLPVVANNFVASSTDATTADEPIATQVARPGFWRSAFWGLVIFLLGGALGFALMASQMWDQLVARISAM